MNTRPQLLQYKMSRFVEIFVPVPQEYMGNVIGARGRNIIQIKRETDTRIDSCNGDNLGRESGFTVIGSATGCEAARQAIRCCVENHDGRTVDVPKECIDFVRGKRRNNIDKIETKSGTKSIGPRRHSEAQDGDTVQLKIIGATRNCDGAEARIIQCIKRWEDNHVKSVSSAASGFRTHSKVNGDVKNINVPKEYIHIVMGEGRKILEDIETKTGTKIRVLFRQNAEAQDGDTVQVKIIGSPKNCDGAESRIRHRITFHKQKMMRYEFGGDKHFFCFAYNDENEKFCLKLGGSAPKLDGFIRGQRYRIETDDDVYPSEISDKTISEIKNHLLTPLQKLNELQDEKQLMADLWCHFGKVFVTCVDEDETQNTFSPVDINGRITKIVSRATIRNDAYWRVSFEEGVDPLDVNDGALPQFGDDNHGFLGLKLVHTQWRYDFGFGTPSYRSVRLKAWEGLPSGSDDKPPVEVKNILSPVFIQAAEAILKAWICYPSVSVLRGEIMTPNSQYDCRIKLRAGSRYVTDKDSVCIEEDAILSNYLSNCKFDKQNHHMYLPNENEHQIPEGFECTFYREAKERMFQATVDEESFTVTVLDEKGWDTDSSDKRHQEQFGIRVVMNSWSEALLSPERHWTPEEILGKLKNYMGFLSLLKNYFFDG